MIGSCQANVERHKVGLGRPEPGVTRSARWPIPVSWEQVQADPDGSTVVRRPSCTGNVAKDFLGMGKGGKCPIFQETKRLDRVTRAHLLVCSTASHVTAGNRAAHALWSTCPTSLTDLLNLQLSLYTVTDNSFCACH